jgi:hypothetical protein
VTTVSAPEASDLQLAELVRATDLDRAVAGLVAARLATDVAASRDQGTADPGGRQYAAAAGGSRATRSGSTAAAATAPRRPGSAAPPNLGGDPIEP